MELDPFTSTLDGNCADCGAPFDREDEVRVRMIDGYAETIAEDCCGYTYGEGAK